MDVKLQNRIFTPCSFERSDLALKPILRHLSLLWLLILLLLRLLLVLVLSLRSCRFLLFRLSVVGPFILLLATVIWLVLLVLLIEARLLLLYPRTVQPRRSETIVVIHSCESAVLWRVLGGRGVRLVVLSAGVNVFVIVSKDG